MSVIRLLGLIGSMILLSACLGSDIQSQAPEVAGVSVANPTGGVYMHGADRTPMGLALTIGLHRPGEALIAGTATLQQEMSPSWTSVSIQMANAGIYKAQIEEGTCETLTGKVLWPVVPGVDAPAMEVREPLEGIMVHPTSLTLVTGSQRIACGTIRKQSS